MKMTDKEYLELQGRILAMASIIATFPMDLDAFIERITIAESVGPVLNPSVYDKGRKLLNNIKEVALATRTYQKKIQSLLSDEK